MVPQYPLCLGWAKSIEEAQAKAKFSGQTDGPRQQRRGFFVQMAIGAGIDRRAGEVVSTGVGNAEIDVEGGWHDGYQLGVFGQNFGLLTHDGGQFSTLCIEEYV